MAQAVVGITVGHEPKNHHTGGGVLGLEKVALRTKDEALLSTL